MCRFLVSILVRSFSFQKHAIVREQYDRNAISLYNYFSHPFRQNCLKVCHSRLWMQKHANISCGNKNKRRNWLGCSNDALHFYLGIPTIRFANSMAFFLPVRHVFIRLRYPCRSSSLANSSLGDNLTTQSRRNSSATRWRSSNKRESIFQTT